MTDPGLNQLLKWGIENSEASRNDPSQPIEVNGSHSGPSFDAEALKALMGGPSDAELMKGSMAAIQSPDVSLDDKLVAFDNFEQLIEQIDNANNMETLGLWTPLINCLGYEEAELRRMAAWCAGTAVQNNLRAQERLLVVGGIPKLVQLALDNENPLVKKKAIYALSSVVRNYQPALDETLRHLPAGFVASDKVDANEMSAVDELLKKLRE